jgi:hypothetical protein
MTSIVGTAAVTTQAGILATVFDLGRTANQNSTVAFSSVSISTQSVSVGDVNVSSFLGTKIVTTSPGILATVFDLGRTANNNSTVAFSSVSISTQSVSVGDVNVSSFLGTQLVTTSPGILATVFDLGRTANPNSTVAFSSLSISSQSVSVGAVNVTSVNGSALVTTSPGVIATVFDLGRTANLTSTVALTGLSINQVTSVINGVTVTANNDKSGYGVSSVNTGVNVTSIVNTPAVTTQAGILASVFDLGRTANPNSTVSFSSLSISSQSVTVGAVNVTSVNGSPLVTTSPGVVATAFDLSNILNPTSTVSLTNLSISTTQTISSVLGAVTLTSGERDSVADALLNRNVSSGASSGRLVKEALYVLRNKVDAGIGIVYGTDDTTSSWSFTVSTQASDPIVSIDPT